MNPNTLETHVRLILVVNTLTLVLKKAEISKIFYNHISDITDRKKTEEHHQRKKQGHYDSIHAALRIRLLSYSNERLLKQ